MFIRPPQGLADTVIPVVLLLDLFPGAKIAYSLRLLRSDYEGPSIRVKRTSDDAEQDIGFLINGDLDVDELTTFVGAADGQVIIIYDQSGNGVNLNIQATPSNLPRIIIAGVLQMLNDLPSLFFNGSDAIESTISLVSPASHLFVFGAWNSLAPGSRIPFNLNSPSSPARVSVHTPAGGGDIIWDAGSVTSDRLRSAQIFFDTLLHVYTFTKTAGTDNQKIKRDGIQIAERTQGTTSTVLDTVTIGGFSSTSGNIALMQFQELVFYDTDELSNVVSIESNLINYWIPSFIDWVNGANNLVNGANNLVFKSGV